MDHDLAGLIDQPESYSHVLRVTSDGMKRSMDEPPDEETPPQMDKLQQELEKLQARHCGQDSQENDDLDITTDWLSDPMPKHEFTARIRRKPPHQRPGAGPIQSTTPDKPAKAERQLTQP